MLTVSGNVNNGGNLLTLAGAGSDTISGGIAGGGGLTANGGAVTLNGHLSFAGSLVLGSGIASLNGNNSYGNIHIVPNDNNNLAGNPTVLNGGVLSVGVLVGTNLPVDPCDDALPGQPLAPAHRRHALLYIPARARAGLHPPLHERQQCHDRRGQRRRQRRL